MRLRSSLSLRRAREKSAVGYVFSYSREIDAISALSPRSLPLADFYHILGHHGDRMRQRQGKRPPSFKQVQQRSNDARGT